MANEDQYTTLDQISNLKKIGTLDGNDGLVITQLINAVSRFVDRQTGRRFYPTSETRYFDMPAGRELWLDEDLLSVTSLTNGDGTVIDAAEYYAYPRNTDPKYKILLKQSSSVYWEPDADGNTEGVIAVAGSWGYCASCPADLAMAVQQTVINIYQNRYGQSNQGAATITGAGVVITPQDVPKLAWEIISKYRRLV